MQGITGINERTRLKMTLIEGGMFCTNSVNYILLNNTEISPKYLLAVLNSALLNFVFKKTSTNSNVNGYEIDNLPIKKADTAVQEKSSILVNRILSAKKRNPKADATALEQEIDQLVYQLYDLTPEEIAVVEASTRAK
jgi:adenine-specific DNA-methyltransferase